MTKKQVDNIKVKGRIGKWYIIDDCIKEGILYYLLESEKYGEDADALVVTSDFKEVLEVQNGFSDLDYLLDV
jgi:hypothetical protein